jgi:hypothetical protein
MTVARTCQYGRLAVFKRKGSFRKALACAQLICYNLMTMAPHPLPPNRTDQGIVFGDSGWHSQRAQFQ